ncbi:hypothetical protein B0H12DRAFT_1127790 [Mycena haematopus]|nr:hypothetical protein B0H12DRAFT_1127790 [Mycena haematopus]
MFKVFQSLCVLSYSSSRPERPRCRRSRTSEHNDRGVRLRVHLRKQEWHVSAFCSSMPAKAGSWFNGSTARFAQIRTQNSWFTFPSVLCRIISSCALREPDLQSKIQCDHDQVEAGICVRFLRTPLPRSLSPVSALPGALPHRGSIVVPDL